MSEAAYDGVEIDMFGIGDADSILVTRWTNNVPCRVLIDAGTKESASTVRNFLRANRINHLDHVVSSHPHADHIGGLIELLEDESLIIGQGWMHFPWSYLDRTSLTKTLMLASAYKRSKMIREAFDASIDLYNLFVAREIQPLQPFTGNQIGFLTVAGPSENYYSSLVHQFSDLDDIVHEEKRAADAESSEGLQDILAIIGKRVDSSETLFDVPETEPENNTSTILVTVFNGMKLLFTGDAGAPALVAAANAYDLKGCTFMQIPHHGSWHNISPALIEHFAPKTAFVSAVGNRKHPRRAVVNAFKEVGAKVYSTHHPKCQNIRKPYGTVPKRSGYSPLPPLWETEVA